MFKELFSRGAEPESPIDQLVFFILKEALSCGAKRILFGDPVGIKPLDSSENTPPGIQADKGDGNSEFFLLEKRNSLYDAYESELQKGKLPVMAKSMTIAQTERCKTKRVRIWYLVDGCWKTHSHIAYRLLSDVLKKLEDMLVYRSEHDRYERCFLEIETEMVKIVFDIEDNFSPCLLIDRVGSRSENS